MSRSRIVFAAAACALALLGQDSPSITVETLGKGFRYTDGPAWSPDGFLAFSDTPGNRVLRWSPGGRLQILRQDFQGPAGNAFDSQGRLYTCETRARRVVRTANGKTEVIAERWDGKRLNAPNDVTVSRSGHVFFTDPAYGDQTDRRELDFFGVYHVSPKGSLTLVAKSAGRPNGIALSPNGRVLYVSDSDAHAVRAYDIDGDGKAFNERVLISGLPGSPGGIAVDEKGNLYVTGGGIGVYTPDGRRIRQIQTEKTASDCAMGEAGKSLFVTARDMVMRLGLGAVGVN